ncbi:MAG: nitroreductase family protein [Alphaproteobacteria bacterium]
MIDPKEFFLTRRSVKVSDLLPGRPSEDDRDTIITAGLRVPDHGKLAPFAFVVFEGAKRGKFCREVLAPRFSKLHPDAAPTTIEIEGKRFEQAGLVIAVIFKPVKHKKVPEWEQQLAVGASAMNMLSCAQALGYGAQWLTQWYSFDDEVLSKLGGDPSMGHKVAGVLYFGGKQTNLIDRDRPNVSDHVTFWP